MRFIEQKINGVYLIQPEPFADERGVFRRHFCISEFKSNGIVATVDQANVSENFSEYTLRGFHYQLDPHAEGKTLSCLKGEIFDIVVDLRPNSQTFGKWISFSLSESSRSSIHIPPGCANAFMTLEPNCLIHYYCSHSYNPDSERGIRYNDPSFDFKWPHEPKIISEKDRSHPNFRLG